MGQTKQDGRARPIAHVIAKVSWVFMSNLGEKSLAPLPAESVPLAVIRGKVLAWYDRNRRDLPWRRRADDPYAQWVAEIMLQQTRVETVEAFYERFLTRFPTVEALARAPHSAVLKHWEGLGYYRRALHLHQAAQLLVAEKREMPRSAAGLRELPGIGEYTSAAIASITFGEPVAAVDGNVTRVMSRLFAVGEDVRTPRGKRRIAELAAAVLNGQALTSPRRVASDPTLFRRGRPSAQGERELRPGDFNQALMDLGSRVCTPREPECGACPIRGHCAALRDGGAAKYPVMAAKAAPREVRMVAGLFVCDGAVLMRRRATGGLWSGLWEPPCAEIGGRGVREVLEEVAAEESVCMDGKPVRAGIVRHQLTHRSLTFRVYQCQLDGAVRTHKTRPGRKWCAAEELAKLAISTAHRKVLGLVL